MIKLYPIFKAHPKDYEKWLENYELKGWHLMKVSLGGWIHKFSASANKKYKYCYDYQLKIKDEYETIFKDAGWELVYNFARTYIWRKAYTDSVPEAYNDYASIISRNNRFILLLMPLLVVYPINIINYDEFNLKSPVIALTYFILTLFFVIAFFIAIRLLLANLKLRKNRKV